MKNVAIYGATDRFNYGDLLFPLVLNWAVRKSGAAVNIGNYAVASSDLSSKGGMPTVALRDVFARGELDTCDHFIVAGGQVLDARWTSILGYLLGPSTDIAIRGVRKVLGEAFTDAAARRIAGIPWPQPFVVPAAALRGQTTLAYNAVGGAEIELLRPAYRLELIRSMQRASHVSVRDQTTLDALAKHGVAAELAPDSAVVMSNAFPKSELLPHLRPSLKAYLEEFRGAYLVFQIGTKFVRGRERLIAKTISGIARVQGLKILLLAIGTATAHEDHLALARVRQHLDADLEVCEVFDGSVWEIMLMIAEAALYIGTSLHGAITAISFGVPRLQFTDEVRKLSEFLNTWDLPQHGAPLAVEGAEKTVSAVMSTGVQVRMDLANRLKAISRKSLARIADCDGCEEAVG